MSQRTWADRSLDKSVVTEIMNEAVLTGGKIKVTVKIKAKMEQITLSNLSGLSTGLSDPIIF